MLNKAKAQTYFLLGLCRSIGIKYADDLVIIEFIENILFCKFEYILEFRECLAYI